jgi:hypothetical protein
MTANEVARHLSQVSSARFGARYAGAGETAHLVDLQELGISMHGLANILNGVFNLYFTMLVKKNPKWHSVRTVALRPESSWSTVEFAAMVNENDFPESARLLCHFAGHYAPALLQAVILTRLRDFDAVDRHVDAFLAASAHWPEPARQVHDGLLLRKSLLLSRVDALTGLLGPSLQNLVQPIGKTCRELLIGRPGAAAAPVVIGEAEAIVIRGHDDLKLVDFSEHRGSIVDIDAGERSFTFCESERKAVISCKMPAFRDERDRRLYEALKESNRTIRISGRAVRTVSKVVKLFVQECSLDDGRRLPI